MRRKYAWESWFGNPRTVIRRGVDYHCSQSTMAQTVRNNASARGIRVKVVDTGNELEIRVVGKAKRKTLAVPHPN